MKQATTELIKALDHVDLHNVKPIGDHTNMSGSVCVPSPYRSLLASLSDSRSVSTSPSLTGPLTFLMMERLLSSMNSTRTWEKRRCGQKDNILWHNIYKSSSFKIFWRSEWSSLVLQQPDGVTAELLSLVKRSFD